MRCCINRRRRARKEYSYIFLSAEPGGISTAFNEIATHRLRQSFHSAEKDGKYKSIYFIEKYKVEDGSTTVLI
jgi:hypothetical protein